MPAAGLLVIKFTVSPVPVRGKLETANDDRHRPAKEKNGPEKSTGGGDNGRYHAVPCFEKQCENKRVLNNFFNKYR
jgi:hypothetical protein